ncbi:bifunctional (p)ppGpp synthetase/guanosine-3',5'-bis(diphosphate) 3'-pyrophosphohydrolase [Candidatus Saccharibacteria bacterium]|nr:bifunctional (p)ppGpp synthetase/guanosine-3',5'-bis(diphosphate) 3'-pyrophosphohydrolase [Candidatus Saccharibacteria bacterium]
MKAEELIELATPLYDPNQIMELTHAIKVATDAHSKQQRASGESYIIHPLAVAGILADWGMDIDTVIAGVLHDCIEDTSVTLEQIESYFGRDVAFLVDGVTKVSKARAGMRTLDSYLPSTKDNLSKLMIAVGQDVRVIIIKLADRLHNMRTLDHLSREKQKKIARETMEVFAPLADRLNMGRVRVQLEELSFRYLVPKDFARTKALMDSRIKKSQRKLSKVQKEVEKHLQNEKIAFEMDGRVKSVYSLYKKLDRYQGDIEKIHDLIALRIIVDDVSSCYLVLGELHTLYQPLYDRIKDYITKPKPNGYQSLHTTVQTKDGQIVEFQVRTHEMHEYAERGFAASFHYNESKLTDAYRKNAIAALPADLSWIRELQEAAAQAKEGKKFNADKFRMKLFSDRIFVYSPKGDIWDLPKDAYPLDFAYRVHSDLAAQTSGFMINGKMKPFSYRLRHGDVVEILTNKSARPKPEWKDYISTNHAREKLRQQLARSGGVVAHITNAASQISRRLRKR